MNDRELLERAAKAAGMWETDFELEEDSETPIFSEEKGFRLAYGRGWWGPHTDDGDSLRLAVMLEIDLSVRASKGWTEASGPGSKWLKVPHGADKDAATRRAILGIAASLPTSKTPNVAIEPRR